MPVRRLICLLLTLFTLPAARASGWSDPMAGDPAVVAYGPSNYRSVDANWSGAVAADGRVYVGNSAVLRFDGRNWMTIAIPGTYAIRALEPDASGRIWVGAVDELGYIEEVAGAPRFTSLRRHLDGKAAPGAIWAVYRVGKYAIFVCEQRVLVWDGAAFAVHELPAPRRLFSFRYRDGVAISQPGGGFWFADGAGLRRLALGGLENEEVGWACDLGAGVSLVITPGGLRRCDGKSIDTLNPELDAFLRHGLVTGAVELPGGFYCIATFRSGAVVIDREGRILRLLDRAAGLPGQELVGVSLGRDGLLCLVGRRFIALFDSTLDTTSYAVRNGANLVNPRTVVLRDAGQSFLLADEALLKLAPAGRTGAQWQTLSEGQFLDGVALPSGDFVFGGLRQIASWRPGRELKVRREVNDVLTLAPIGADRFVAAVGNALRLGHAAADGPEWDQGEVKFAESISDLAVRGDEIWAAMDRRGVRVLDTRDLAELRGLEAGREFPANFTVPRFMRVGSRWLIRSGSGTFAMAGTKPEPVAALAGVNLIASERFPPEAANDIWAVAADASGEGVSLLRLAEETGVIVPRFHPLAAAATVGRPVFLQRDAGGALWVVGATGLLRLDPDALDRASQNHPILTGATLQTSRETISLGAKGDWSLPAGVQRLTIQFRVEPQPAATPVLIESRLAGQEIDWQTSLGVREYSRLPAGKYVFEVRLPGEPTSASLAAFEVRSPWYVTPWFLAVAGVATLGLIWLLVHLRLKQVAARNKALAALVESQTNELTKAVAAKSAFIAQLGHELRNPLNGVVGLASALRGMPLQERESDIAERIASCAGQLSSVVEDVLEFSLVEAGKVQLKQRRFHLLEPVRSAIFVCEAAGSLRPQLVAAEAMKSERPRMGDPDRIRQILANYLENARKYARGSEVVVTVQATSGYRVVFGVADKGPGLQAMELAQLFERFSRGEDARRRGIPGTGLGLAACRAYATAMGGRVWAESTPGKGSTFFLELTLPYAEAQQEAPVLSTRRILEGWSVFVVDDHDYNLFVLSDILQKMGATVRTADSMAAAWKLFETALPDLMFLDLDLGTESGLTLARQIRESTSSYRDVPIIATSAFELDDIREGCLKAGMNAFISKPVTAEKVAAAARQIESLTGGGMVVVPEMPPARGRSNLDLLSDGDPATRERVIASARKALSEAASALTAAAEKRDLDGMRRHAHAITSAALTIDLGQVASLARETERCARRNATDECVENTRLLIAALRDSGSLS